MRILENRLSGCQIVQNNLCLGQTMAYLNERCCSGDTFRKRFELWVASSGSYDFELWYFSVIRNHRCIFDDRPARHWYHMLGFGPPVEGFHVSDHYNMNEQLVAFIAS